MLQPARGVRLRSLTLRGLSWFLYIFLYYIRCLVRGNNNEDATAPCENHLSRSIEYLPSSFTHDHIYAYVCVLCIA